MLGHSSLETTKGYLHTVSGAINDMGAKINDMAKQPERRGIRQGVVQAKKRKRRTKLTVR
jgi:hypothetical protein